jgi:hypothetical protein
LTTQLQSVEHAAQQMSKAVSLKSMRSFVN